MLFPNIRGWIGLHWANRNPFTAYGPNNPQTHILPTAGVYTGLGNRSHCFGITTQLL